MGSAETMGLYLLMVSFLAGQVLTLSEGCSLKNEEQPTLDYKIVNSDLVVHGVPKSAPKEAGDGNVYSVQFENRCVYKGSPVDELIRIDQDGEVPDLCVVTNLMVNKSYLVYLKKVSEGVFTQTFPHDPATNEYLDEITAYCETKVSYPTGYSLNNNKEECRDTLPPSECFQTVDITDEPTDYANEGYVALSGEQQPGNPSRPDPKVIRQPAVAPSKEEQKKDTKMEDKKENKKENKKEAMANEDNGSATSSTWHMLPLLVVVCTLLL